MATGFRLSAPGEYRRGVVLGLTLAEVLVLLVFLLLLAMTALVLRKEREQGVLRIERDQYAEIVRIVQKMVVNKDGAIDDTRLANLVADGEAADGLRSALKEARAEAERARKEASAKAQVAQEATALASVLERFPGSPKESAAVRLEGALARLSTTEALQARAAEVERESQRTAQRQAQMDAQMANLTGQNNQMRGELGRLKGNGGSGLPYCWASPDGRAQYMLKVDMRDDGVAVRDIAPRVRPDDPVWQTLDQIGRSQMMPLEAFMRQVAPIQAKAAADRCRYAIEVVDLTGRTNKPGYKQSMGRLWTAFHIHEVPQ